MICVVSGRMELLLRARLSAERRAAVARLGFGYEDLRTCVPLPILSLSGVDRHDYLSPSFSVLCELWVELVLFQIAPHSVQTVHPPQSGPSSRSLPHLHRCYLLCNIRVFSSRYMAIPRSFWVTYVVVCLTIASLLNVLIPDSVFPCLP